MLRGIYSAATTMDQSIQKMNIFAQNLSNSQTTGYKKKTYSVHSFKDMVVNVPGTEQEMKVATGSYLTQARVDQGQGRLKRTQNALDLAIQGEGKYFQLEVNQGNQPVDPNNPEKKVYTITRNGNFKLDRDNYIVNANGDFLLDTQNRRMRLTQTGVSFTPPPQPGQSPAMSADRIRINQLGDIRMADTADPAALARVKVVEFTDNHALEDLNVKGTNLGEMKAILKKYGLDVASDSNLLQTLDPLPAANQGNRPDFTVEQGYLETSNVDVTSSIISLMLSSKDYGMSQKLIAAQDKILDKTINEMGRLQ